MIKISILEYINDLQNWFITYEKQYSVLVCRPKLGYRVTNKIAGETYYTNKQKQFVISRCSGEEWVISGKELTQQYKTIDGQQITEETIKQWLGGNETFDWQKIVYKASKEIKWAIQIPLEFQNSPFIGSQKIKIQYINKRGATHGSGDFLVAGHVSGFPNLFDIKAVNGEIFYTLFDTARLRGG